jgi:hypothetical protein
VASLEHRTHVVETRHAGGIGRRGLVRVSLHHAWWLQLDSSRPTPYRGTGGAPDAERLLRYDQAMRGASLAGGTPLCIQPSKISTSPCCDLCEAMPVAGVTIPPPGAGHLMWVRRLAPFLSDLTLPETIDTTHIHRVADVTGAHTTFVIASPSAVQIYTWGSGAHTWSSR